MTVRVVATPYGPAALAALRDVVVEAKRHDPLAPVTILVPNNIAGIAARRFLAHGLADGRRGIAGVYLSTLPRLAEQVAAADLYPRTPATATIVASAWRSALDESPGVFASVSDHPATLRALAAAHRELRDLSEAGLTAVASCGPLQQSLVKLHRRVAATLGERHYDVTDLVVRAAALIEENAETVRRFGDLVLHLPQQPTRAEVRLTRALAAAGDLTILAGVTGDSRADAAVARLLDSLGGPVPAHPHSPAVASQVVHASDSDDEVRHIVREVVAALRSVPAHRITVLHTSDVPYARLLHEHLTQAGIAINGRGTRPLAERSIARGLLAVLELPAGLPRAKVFQALGALPTRSFEGDTIPMSRWERVSRLAGVVDGTDWDTRLRRYADAERAGIDRQRASDAPLQGRIDNHRREIETADALGAFARTLAARLDAGSAATSWAALAEWALELFHDLYGGDAVLARIPAEEQYAAAAIERILQGMAGLDVLGVPASRQRLSDLLALELDSALPRVGRFGTGVFVGPLSAAIGLDADLVIVAGLTEDLCPGRMREDALLPAAVRERAGELRLPDDRLDAQRRHLFAALGGAPSVVATFPRGDLRRSTERLPSRWLLPTLRALTGRPDLVAVEWDRHHSDRIVAVRSHAAELLAADPATEQEWRVRAISAHAAPSDEIVDNATHVIESRVSAAFSRFDGNLAGAEDLPDFAAGERRVSPTSLETFATCPHAYFVGRMLGVEPIEQPEAIITISPLDVGNLIHETMDAFIRDRASSLPGYGEPWTADDRHRLREIAEAQADDFVARGATGHPLLWERERAVILDDLDRMLTDDSGWRAEHSARVVASELTFGKHGADPVAIDVPGGRVLMVGSADKVDETRDGVLLITDIKTGGSQRFKAIAEDPVAGGTKLQLPVYAHAARQLLGGTDVRAQYWFVRRDRGTRIEVALDEAVEARYASTIGTLVGAISVGLFPAKAPEKADWNWVQCWFCNPDGLGHSAARERWERKRSDQALADLVALVEPASVAIEADAE